MAIYKIVLWSRKWRRIRKRKSRRGRRSRMKSSKYMLTVPGHRSTVVT